MTEIFKGYAPNGRKLLFIITHCFDSDAPFQASEQDFIPLMLQGCVREFFLMDENNNDLYKGYSATVEDAPFPSFQEYDHRVCAIRYTLYQDSWNELAQNDDDDRIFSSTDMYEFGYKMVLAGMAAGFTNSKNIEGVDPALYVKNQLENEEGDGEYERWEGSAHDEE